METLTVQTEFPPKRDGVYVAYTEHSMGDVNSLYPEKRLLMFHRGEWGYLGSDQSFGGKVYGYLGPLPQPPIKTLLKANVSFAVGEYYKGGRGGDVGYHNGPFATIKEALGTVGSIEHFIFKLSADKDVIKELYKWLDGGWTRSQNPKED